MEMSINQPVNPATELNPLALEALSKHQRQLDQDGVEVGVSRQALDEVLSYVARIRAETAKNSGEVVAWDETNALNRASIAYWESKTLSETSPDRLAAACRAYASDLASSQERAEKDLERGRDEWLETFGKMGRERTGLQQRVRELEALLATPANSRAEAIRLLGRAMSALMIADKSKVWRDERDKLVAEIRALLQQEGE